MLYYVDYILNQASYVYWLHENWYFRTATAYDSRNLVCYNI